MSISAGFWDVMHHLLNKPETFFSPPHALLYFGVATALVGSIILFLSWRWLDPESRSMWRFPFIAGIGGIFILVAAGPIDFAWHSAFGLDGLLSPPHQILLSGMFLCAISSAISIIRYTARHHPPSGLAMRGATLTLLAGWLTVLGYIYSYSLPFSDTEFFQFNPDVWFAATFATITLPFVGAVVLILASRLVNLRFGVLSCLGAALLAVNGAATILSNPALGASIPFYAMAIIPIMAADYIISSYKNRRGIIAAGIIVGPLFYFMYYPYVTYIYNGVIFNKVISGSVTFQVFFEQLPIIIPAAIVPAIVMGILGAVLSDRIVPVITGKKAYHETITHT